MILGVGIDVVSISRIDNALKRFGEKFLIKCFHPEERAHGEARPQILYRTLAKRFAAKEACAKAFGVGIGKNLGWKDVYVVKTPSGQPQISLSPKGEAFLKTLTPAGFSPKIHISLADDEMNAHATVIISLWPISEMVTLEKPQTH